MSQNEKIMPLSLKYRPKSLDEVVGRAPIVSKLREFIAQGYVPNMLFYGLQGSGKTLIADLFLKEYQGKSYKRGSHLVVDASKDNSVNNVRDVIVPFMQTASAVGNDRKKVLVLDEFDFISTPAQATLRRPIETSMKVLNVIVMCNYIDKVIRPIQSRLTAFAFTPISIDDIGEFVSMIIDKEGISIDGKLEDYLNHMYIYGRGEIRFILNNYMEHARAAGVLDKRVLDLVFREESNYAELLFSGRVDQAIAKAYENPRGSISGAIDFILTSKTIKLSYENRIKIMNWFYDTLIDLTNGVPYNNAIKMVSHRINVVMSKARAKTPEVKKVSKPTKKIPS